MAKKRLGFAAAVTLLMTAEEIRAVRISGASLGATLRAVATFDYSPALTAEPGNWTFEKLDAYLKKPAAAIPGNRMGYAGMRKAQDRADVIAYLRGQGATQIPLPEPTPDYGGGE